MACCDPWEAEDKEVTGQCKQCGNDVNKDGETVHDRCSYSPIECDTCGDQPCDWSC